MPADINEKYKYRVSISTKAKRINREVILTDWREFSARAIELFGLPGHKYKCSFQKDSLDFYFIESKDALFFELCCG